MRTGCLYLLPYCRLPGHSPRTHLRQTKMSRLCFQRFGSDPYVPRLRKLVSMIQTNPVTGEVRGYVYTILIE